MFSQMRDEQVKTKRTNALLVVGLLTATMSIAILYFLETGKGRSGKGVSALDASRDLFHFRDIPASASDVDYDSSIRSTRVEFIIDEREFLKWCEMHHWRPNEIVKPTIFSRAAGGGMAIIAKGLEFSVRNESGATISGVFDRTKGRASVSFLLD